MKISGIEKIPFLPIDFFKHFKVISDKNIPGLVFSSSGTTGLKTSKHYIVDPELYIKSFTKTFIHFFGDPSDYCFLGLLPGYLERPGSSLIFMINELMKLSGHPENGFYLNDFENLRKKISCLKQDHQKYILIGVTYSLLDFASIAPTDMSDGIVIETGGMKGKRKEMIKPEIHNFLKQKLNCQYISSEYGMTELLSQAYSKKEGFFETPAWMKILIRDPYDPYHYLKNGNSGGINIIDLANIYSCSFIETKDLGRINRKGQFEILGRFDNADIRGCNLLVS